jgi:alpha-glucuronidase
MKTNEYDCWLQPWGIKDIPKALAEILSTVRTEEQGDILARAVAEFRRGISRSFGFSEGVSSKETIIGTIAHLNASLGISLPQQKAEGFVLHVTDTKAVIAGQDQRGALYGVYRFLALLRLGKITTGTLLADAPAASRRIINHWDNLDGTVERGYAGNSLFYRDDHIDFDPQRIEDYARILASIGVNRISINNANVRRAAKGLITEQYLPEVAKLSDIFRPFGIQILLSVNFASPYLLGSLSTADPLDPAVAEWWKKQADVIYRYIPDLAGFVVKADSEFEPGPFQYGRTHADGANMLANALKPHNGEVIWRCFVYNCVQDWRDHSVDRARATYDHFMPLDGSFADNVLLQIKFGPYDFQVREPVSPLFGALSKTRHIMELQITQEYTGQQIDVCYLPWIWEDIMRFDTGYGEAARIRELLDRNTAHPKIGIEGLAGVGNIGLDRNWTGHTLAQANLYGYGRLAWNPELSADSIADEWSRLTFGDSATAETVKHILLQSYPVYEKYNAPFGVCFMVNPGVHYGPSPEGYEFSKWGTYHRADSNAVGIDRTPAGTGYAEQYSPQNASLFRDPAKCPEEYILFFHRLRYDYRMKNGETLLQNIYNTHFEGAEEVEAILQEWKKLKGKIDETVYAGVLSRMERQLQNAREWRDVINTYFYRKTGIPDAKGRKIYE